MTPEDYQQAGNLFNQLRELPESERAAALDGACAGNDELHARVLRLLEADCEAGGSFMRCRAIEDAAELLAHPLESKMPGARLGPYEIGELIGAGGMGEVDKARDTRLDRIVAVKISDLTFLLNFFDELRRRVPAN